MKNTVVFVFFLIAVLGGLRAQTPPCGVEVIRTEGPKIDERFVPAPPEQVKFALLRALPAVAAKADKDNGVHIKAKTDEELYLIEVQKNHDEGLHGRTAGRGAWLYIDYHEQNAPEPWFSAWTNTSTRTLS